MNEYNTLLLFEKDKLRNEKKKIYNELLSRY